jgi:hypothetical protein
VGVNEAVITDVPPATIVALLVFTLSSEMTPGVPDEYVKVPGIEGVGDVKVKAASPIVFVTFDHVNVGMLELFEYANEFPLLLKAMNLFAP